MSRPSALRSAARISFAFACFGLAVGLVACASPNAESIAPGATTAAANSDADRRFYEGRCGVCHVPYAKSDFSAEEWPAIVDEMAPRSGLSRSQRLRVLRYLTSQ